MKSIIRKGWLSVVLAVAMVFTLCFGVVALFAQRDAKEAFAAGETTTATLSVANAKKATDNVNWEVVRGKEFDLTITLHSTKTGTGALTWFSIAMKIGAIAKNGTTTTDTDGTTPMFSQEIGTYLSFDKTKTHLGALNDTGAYDGRTGSFDDFKKPKGSPGGAGPYCVRLNVSANPAAGEVISSSTDVVITAKIKIATDLPADVTSITFGASTNGAQCSVGYYDAGANKNISDTYSAVTKTMAIAPVTVIIRDANNDATLQSLEAGHAADAASKKEWTASSTPALVAYDSSNAATTTLAYTSNVVDLTDFFTKAVPTDANVTKLEVAFKTYDAANGNAAKYDYVDVNAYDGTDGNEKYKLSPLTLHSDGSDSEVRIKVTAEDETTFLEYRVIIKIGYVRLQDLTVQSHSTTASVTKKDFGFQADGTTPVVFDKETDTYNVYVPKDSVNATPEVYIDVTGTVLGGYGSSSNIKVTPTSCTAADAAGVAIPATGFASGNTIKLNGIQVGSQAVLTVTAQDGTTTKDYTLTLIPLSVDTGIDPFQVEGPSGTKYDAEAEDSKMIPTDWVKPTDGTPFYYFILMRESTYTGAMKITLKDAGSDVGGRPKIVVAWVEGEGASATSRSENYSDTRQFPKGDYSVTITAEAGNSTTYKVAIAMPMALKLIDDSVYAFVLENALEIEGETYYNRLDYATKGWTHGVDDLELGLYVLGHVKTYTSINTFLAQIFEPHKTMVKLYAVLEGEATLVYNCGTLEDAFADLAGDGNTFAVGTGWYMDFGPKDAADPIERVYISVLGDLDGNGQWDAFDTSNIYSYMAGNLNNLYGNYDANNDPELARLYRLSAMVTNELGLGISVADVSAIYSLIAGAVNVDIYFDYSAYTALLGGTVSYRIPEEAPVAKSATIAAKYEEVEVAAEIEVAASNGALEKDTNAAVAVNKETADISKMNLYKFYELALPETRFAV